MSRKKIVAGNWKMNKTMSEAQSLITELKAETATINGDKMHVTNIIFNLIDNALKYTTEKPLIKITTFNNKDGIFIEVQDNGIGISKENQERIFDTKSQSKTFYIMNVSSGYAIHSVKYSFLIFFANSNSIILHLNKYTIFIIKSCNFY